jgi:tetratricopeptide (TPR) repeat protein
LKSLTPELAEIVGAHLLRAGQLLGEDPALAYAHAEAARRRASRLAVTREATGEAAYAAGEYAVALAEFRALRRMNGGVEYLAAMADCERALGHPDRALKLVKEGLAGGGDAGDRVELRLVEAGARLDLGQVDEALRLLKTEIESIAGKGSRASRARLRYGYADVLERSGDVESAERWFAAAAVLDTDGETDATDRVAALQGMVLEIDEDDLVGGDPEPEQGSPAESEGSAAEAADDETSTGAEEVTDDETSTGAEDVTEVGTEPDEAHADPTAEDSRTQPDSFAEPETDEQEPGSSADEAAPELADEAEAGPGSSGRMDPEPADEPEPTAGEPEAPVEEPTPRQFAPQEPLLPLEEDQR